MIEKAIKDRFILLDQKKQRITYLPQGKERSLKNPEEQVQLSIFLKLIYHYQYPPEQIRVCELIKMGSATKEADIVVYADEDCKSPLIIVECKKKGVSSKVFTEAINQGFSYAVTVRAKYVWVTTEDQNAFYEVWDQSVHEREANQLPDIPHYQANTHWSYLLKRKAFKIWRGYLRDFFKHPIVVDTLVFSVFLLFFMLTLSYVAIEYDQAISRLFQHLPSRLHPHWGWVFNFNGFVSIVFGVEIALRLLTGLKFIPKDKKKRRLFFYPLIILLFIPIWLIQANYPLRWWNEVHYLKLDYKIFLYLLPYLEALGMQILIILAVAWINTRKQGK